MTNKSKHPLLIRYQEHLHSGVYRTALEVLEALRAEGWHLEVGSETSKVFWGWINPKVGLQILTANQYSDSSTSSDYSFTNPATGSWIHIKNALSANCIEQLNTICDRCFPNPGIPPVQLQTIADEQRSLELFTELGIVNLIKYLAKEIQPKLGSSLTILGTRTLLRRTYPIGIKYQVPSINMHNQDWHQDSNPIFGARPMLTIWIPLQNKSGTSRPGISIMKAPINRFHANFGDGYTKAKSELEKEFGKVEIEIPLVNAGDAVVFNGLTFHKTLSNKKMMYHRDALLIRIVRSHEAKYFPTNRNDNVAIKI